MKRRMRSLARSVPRHLPGIERRLLTLGLACILSWNCPAQGTSADEYEIRAAMLFNLTKFIEWPTWKMDGAHPDFQVCMLGADPLGSELETMLQRKIVRGKPVVLRHLANLESVESCHILYVGAGERKTAARASAELAKRAILTISERSNLESPGQVIGLPTSEEHVHIDVNLGGAQKSGLTVSSKLLHLATVTY
jgi:hypothetical protein